MFATMVSIGNAAIMDQQVYRALFECDAKSFQEFVPVVVCNASAAAQTVDFDTLFPTLQLKRMQSAFTIWGTGIMAALQQLDWSYSCVAVFWATLMTLATCALKAPPQDFSFYFSPFDLKFETKVDIYVDVFVSCAMTCVFIIVLLYQLSRLRRQRFAYHEAAETLHSIERREARQVMIKQRNQIKDMQDLWRLDEDQIKIDSLLANGANGQVFRGRVRFLGESVWHVVAIKKFAVDDDDDDDDEIDFDGPVANDESLWAEEEIKIMLQLRHDRLVRFFGAGRMRGRRFIVSELVNGLSIERRLWGTSQNTLNNRSRLVWARDVAMAMEYLHSRGYIHRDLKTPNILHDVVTGRAKITDFGLVKSLCNDKSVTCSRIDLLDAGNAEHRVPQRRSSGTKWEVVSMTSGVGSLPWMAPELLSAFVGGEGTSSYGGGIDVYAFGIVLWELISHKRPWIDAIEERADSEDISISETIVTSVREGKRPGLSHHTTMLLPDAYFDLMNACWSHTPSRRPKFTTIAVKTKIFLDQCELQEKASERESKRGKLKRHSTGEISFKVTSHSATLAVKRKKRSGSLPATPRLDRNSTEPTKLHFELTKSNDNSDPVPTPTKEATHHLAVVRVAPETHKKTAGDFGAVEFELREQHP
eukprot:g1468.t1